MSQTSAITPQILVIGGGAAGFFAAITCAETNPNAKVELWEKSGKLLSKVKVSGGGRCNVTHACFSISELINHYPRGGKSLKSVFGQFMTTDTIAWFEKRGVTLKTETDGRMFPTTDDSQTIVNCLQEAAQNANVKVRTYQEVVELNNLSDGGWYVTDDQDHTTRFDAIIVATGGTPKRVDLQWLSALGHQLETPVPSLFTFNMPAEPIRNLTGITVPEVKVKIAGMKLEAKGALLITHWGMSGPAILRLSAWGARILAEANYTFTALVNWVPNHTEAAMRKLFDELKAQPVARKCANRNPFNLPQRVWDFLLEKAEIGEDMTWKGISGKAINRLMNVLTNDAFAVLGKTTFKEEFVTCGGISLKSVDMNTMQSRACPNLYFAGEILDIDGITGGFNFQAAWSTGFVAGREAGKIGG